MTQADLAFLINYQYTNLLDTTPFVSEPTWAWLAVGIDTIDSSPSDKTSEREDYSTGGTTQTKVTGINKEYSVSGTRCLGDPAQDYISSIAEGTGSERETTLRTIGPDGRIIDEPVTIKDININNASGAGSDEQAISFTMVRRDTPTLVKEGYGKHLPTSVTAEAVTVAEGGFATVTPTVEPSTASDWCTYGIGDKDIATVTADGKIKGIKAGKTTLTVKCATKPAVRVSIDVTVTAE